jgi:hypothetical protein
MPNGTKGTREHHSREKFHGNMTCFVCSQKSELGPRSELQLKERARFSWTWQGVPSRCLGNEQGEGETFWRMGKGTWYTYNSGIRWGGVDPSNIPCIPNCHHHSLIAHLKGAR